MPSISTRSSSRQTSARTRTQGNAGQPAARGISPRKTFRVWLVIYALVGAQMGWVLRPFIGAPHLPFELFRARESNIFVDVLHTLRELLTK